MARGRNENGAPILLGALVVLVLGLLGIFLVHGSGSSGDAIPNPPVESAPVSPALDLNVYLDGSGSIRHFLEQPPASGDRPVPPNYVREVLDKLETTLHNAPADAGSGAGWHDVTLRFFRFGNDARPTSIPSNGGLQQMSGNPGAFTESNTRIEIPVQQAAGSTNGEPRPELKIILTDLYQSGGELEKPADALADRYLRGETGAVGILAVRSSFTGPVEDLPGTHGRTLPGAADSMPFYLLFAGEAPDVRHAMEVVIAGTGLGDAFHRKLATEILFTRAPLPRGTDAMRFTGDGYSLVSRDASGTHIEQVSLRKGVLRATWTDPRLETPDLIPVGGAPVLAPQAFRVEGGRSLTPDADAAAAARPCAGGEPLCATVDRDGLQSGKTYLFQFNLMETQGSDALEPDSAALRDWNIEVPEAERIAASPQPVFPAVPGVRVGERPGRTPDLSKFLLALQGAMFHAPVRVTSYDLSVEAR